MTTNVPFPILTATGFFPPTEQQILTGEQADWNAAFNTTFNWSAPGAQTQMAISMAAIIGNANDTFCALANGIDPAFAYGRMQDAIGRIYFLQRLPGSFTTVQCLCVGEVDVIVSSGSLAQDASGNVYSTNGFVFPSGGQITVPFYCNTVGPVACPANTLNVIYQAQNGWDTINNPSDGVLGTNVETRAEFELRRQNSVAANSVSPNQAVLGSLLGDDAVTGLPNVPGILDAYVTDNSNNYDIARSPIVAITGSIAATTLTVTIGDYTLIKAGMAVTGGDGTGVSVLTGTTISSGSGPTFTVNHSQTVGSTGMNIGGVVLPPNCLYVAEVGGASADVAEAIWRKKTPGCSYYSGNTSATVYDPGLVNGLPVYTPPGIPYMVTWETPPSLPFVFRVNIVNNPDIPGDAAAQIQAAIIAAFAGSVDGVPRARIGSKVLATRFIPVVAALGSWAEIESLLMGTTNDADSQFTAAIGATYTGAGSGTNLTVSSIVGFLSVGDTVLGTGVPAGTTIVSQSSGTTGSNGVYVTTNATTIAGPGTTTSVHMKVSAVVAATLAVGQYVFDAAFAVVEGTKITAQTSGSAGDTGTYTLSMAQQVVSRTMYGVNPDESVITARINQAPTTDATIIEVNIV